MLTVSSNPESFQSNDIQDIPLPPHSAPTLVTSFTQSNAIPYFLTADPLQTSEDSTSSENERDPNGDLNEEVMEASSSSCGEDIQQMSSSLSQLIMETNEQTDLPPTNESSTMNTSEESILCSFSAVHTISQSIMEELVAILKNNFDCTKLQKQSFKKMRTSWMEERKLQRKKIVVPVVQEIKIGKKSTKKKKIEKYSFFDSSKHTLDQKINVSTILPYLPHLPYS